MLRNRSTALVLALAISLLSAPAAAQPSAPSAAPSNLPVGASPHPAAHPLGLSPDGTAPLEGTTWRLTRYLRDQPREPGPEVAAWLTLRGGRVTGSGGCTPLRGRYARIGEAVAFQLRGGPRPECAEQTMLVQRAVRSALQRAASAQVSRDDGRDVLVIHDASGAETLRFEPDDVSDLESGEWRLAMYVQKGGSVAADPDQLAVLRFRPTQRVPAERRSSGELIGSSGCNGLLGTYARAGDVLSIAELASTGAPCSQALTAQEAAIVDVLESRELLIDLPADRLVLTGTGTGTTLEYIASAPLEGATWRLDRVAGSPRPSQPVTLRLEGGTLEGEGPCGPYAGSYVTDGRYITFRELAAADPSRCVQADDERALLRAMAATVLVERARPGLRFLDAGGRVLARFSPAAAGP